MTTTKSNFQPLPARRSSPRTRSKSLSEPNPSPRTFSKAFPKPNPSPCTFSKALPKPNPSSRTCSGVLPKPNSSPGTNGIFQSPFSLGAITPIETLKSISLSDWWLTKKGKEKKALSITGFESKGGSGVRLFSSGTISKRHNSTTLEAIDGITICISGFINRSRSLENGVSNEVCNRFQLGFPYNWEDYNEEEEEEEKKNLDTDFGISFDDVPVSRFQDLSSLEGCLKRKILDDVVGSLRDLVCSKSDKECDVDSLVSRVVGVKTRGMLRRREEYEASIGKIVSDNVQKEEMITTKKKKRRRMFL